MGNFLRKAGSCFFRFKFKIGNDHHKFKSGEHLLLDPMNAASVKNGSNNTAEKCRSGIIRVSLHLGGKIYQVIKSQGISHKGICPHKTCDNTGRRAAKTSRHGNIVDLFNVQTVERTSAYLKKSFCRIIDKI